MKRLFVILGAVLCVMAATAQGNGQEQKFSPEKFDAELQEFITKEASLTPQEAAKFFPVYKEMQTKQRALFERQKNLGMMKPEDEKTCLKAIRERDEIEMEMKRIQQSYHEKFLEQMSATKVYSIIQAEDRFHRRMLKRWSSYRPQNQRPGMSPQGQKFGWPPQNQRPGQPK